MTRSTLAKRIDRSLRIAGGSKLELADELREEIVSASKLVGRAAWRTRSAISLWRQSVPTCG
jgi:hypothetical protein